jgi:hypothetical protein
MGEYRIYISRNLVCLNWNITDILELKIFKELFFVMFDYYNVILCSNN